MGKKNRQVCLLNVENLKKKKNQDKDIDRLSVRVTEFVMMRTRFVTKQKEECFFLQKEKEGRGGRDAGYNFNITDGFHDGNY